MSDPHAATQDESFDLNALESTRFGLELFGAGVLLLLCGMGLGLGQFTAEGRAPSWRVVDLVTGGLSMLGYLLIIAGTWISYPRPHGPLAAPLRLAVVALYVLAIAMQVYDYLAADPSQFSDGYKRFAELFWTATELTPPALAWIMWRYAVRSGLDSVGRLWLGTAFVWTVIALVIEFGDAYWVGRFYMAIGVLVFFAAYLTAKDLWMDAVVRGTRSMIAQRRR